MFRSLSLRNPSPVRHSHVTASEGRLDMTDPEETLEEEPSMGGVVGREEVPSRKGREVFKGGVMGREEGVVGRNEGVVGREEEEGAVEGRGLDEEVGWKTGSGEEGEGERGSSPSVVTNGSSRVSFLAFSRCKLATGAGDLGVAS
ncbi:unnamed protein product [Closterium sp. NIES-65]|nr:unnamed protein product [Closterium sp. NIES-65]